MANLGLAGFAVLFLLAGNLITTIGSREVVKVVTEHGNKIGLYAEQGSKFMAMTWATLALMLLAVFYWVYEFFAQKKRNAQLELSRNSMAFNRPFGAENLSKSEPGSLSSSRTSSGFGAQEGMVEVPIRNERTGRFQQQPFSPPGQGSYGYNSGF